MTVKPTTKEDLQTDLHHILVTVEGKLDPATAQKMKHAMDKLLEQDNRFNRAILANAVDELLVVSDSKELHTEEIRKILTFLESLKSFLATGLKNLYEYDNYLKEEQKKISSKIKDIQERQQMRFNK